MNRTDPPLHAVLGDAALRPRWRRLAAWLVLVGIVLALAGGWWWFDAGTSQSQPRFVTEPVVRGNLVVKVTANGTLQPTNKVEIGSELSGTVARVLVDVNDRVAKGQTLAELDTSKLRDQVARSRAGLEVARANVRQAQATVQEASGNLQRLQEVARLSGGKVPSQAELASAQAALARAQSGVASAAAGVADARAAASADQTNLRKASIRSPIDGVVLSRSVDPGNAVAASLQAVTLFTLAEDLTRMKLAVNVDEADVGLVGDGQQATFTVSAYPSRNYPATITRVSYGSTTKDNVVTYVAELQVDNKDLTLRPGMSATASILATERKDVLLVPNAALRFAPEAAAQAPAPSGLVTKLMPRPPRDGARKARTTTAAARRVWVLEDGSARAVAVVPGVSDGRLTEVASDTLQPGMAVIIDQAGGSAK
ncbi:efflux RND transporter periplasmic adaptor subunit [Ramlibacter sp.]|uniref:efflux RND transporter periplasmic adaptor subunit n=1 Tax=Ramlibacter sp. TaxID=1917967 RepID=UPI002BB8C4FB|nr:efflux RND transporter periplasmic adaptor subunit [Ramlibacter sp.]HWI82476.1 efflux RND transporter periplasmic adaptor subunit [Ramlibacter sp.]